jgi:hypothetical protein
MAHRPDVTVGLISNPLDFSYYFLEGCESNQTER